MSRDRVVLSFHESLLRESDVDILRGPRWLNDVLISFYFEYLEAVQFKKSDHLVLFVSPEVTQCIKVSSPQEISIFLEPLRASSKEFVLFALNDNVRTDSSGGSHWSLLAFSRPERAFFHFDSHTGSNAGQARQLAGKLLRHFGLPAEGRAVEMDCLQQSNGYDCGVHVLCNAEHVANFALRHGRVSGCPNVDEAIVHNKRVEFLNLIRRLKGA